jgi:transcriptional regulator with XRE-family HTH domain
MENPYTLEQLISLIDKSGIAHNRIAQKMNVFPQYFSRIYKGKTRPRLDICEKIANAIYELKTEKSNVNQNTIKRTV